MSSYKDFTAHICTVTSGMTFTHMPLIPLKDFPVQLLLFLFSGVYGKVQLHSAYTKKSWTHLRADIASGNERWGIRLSEGYIYI